MNFTNKHSAQIAVLTIFLLILANPNPALIPYMLLVLMATSVLVFLINEEKLIWLTASADNNYPVRSPKISLLSFTPHSQGENTQSVPPDDSQTNSVGTYANALQREPISILLVESDMNLVGNLTTVLSRHFRVYVEVDGHSALSLIKKTAIKMVILGPGLRNMRTDKFCRSIRALKKNEEVVSIIELLDDVTKKTRLDSLKSGVDNCVGVDEMEELLFWVNKMTQSNNLKTIVKKDSDGDKQIIVADEYDEIFISRLYQVLDRNIENPQFSTISLCETMRISRTQMHRKIKLLFGIAAGKFIRNYRLEKAYALLQDNNKSVEEVMLLVGFRKLGHFSKCFKNKHGVLPSKVKWMEEK